MTYLPCPSDHDDNGRRGAGLNQTGFASSPGRSGDQISPFKRHTILDIGPVNIFNLKKKGKKGNRARNVVNVYKFKCRFKLLM